MNCSQTSKISGESPNAVITEDDNPYKELEEEIESSVQFSPMLFQTLSSFTDVDTEVAAVKPPLLDAEIIADFLDTKDASNGDDDGDNGASKVRDESLECPDRN